MLLVICGFALAGLAGLLVWYASSRWWHPIAIGFPALALFPWVATYVAGDVSRYLPAGLFSDSQQGKDEIAVASAYATIIISIALAGVGFWLTGGRSEE